VRWLIERHVTVPSTMDLAGERASSGAPAGLVIVADEQTAGRGRHGREWLAPTGTSLLCTVVARPEIRPTQLPALPLEVAEYVARAVWRVSGVECRIKPPNDLMIGDRKLAGVLCQSMTEGHRITRALIGIGVNVNISREDLPVRHATSLLIETTAHQSIDVLLKAVLDELSTSRWFTVPQALPDAGRAVSARLDREKRHHLYSRE
jgi:BirA family transcriptional regulator, biotin operon repressor / biotin---[acetyl-CoA-carboxylase] ligase